METHVLGPFSQGEAEGPEDTFVDRVFDGPAPAEREDPYDLSERIVRGGFPPVVVRSARRRDAWLRSYVAAVLQREVRDIANVERLEALPRLPQTTLQRYLTLLEHVFLVVRVPAWQANLGKRLVRSPKLHLVDTGLAAHLVGASARRLGSDGMLFGQLLESFVGMELVKQASWSARMPRVHHFRTSTGQEVDFVLEDREGSVVGIEVKGTAAVGSRDIAGLRLLRDSLGERFRRGVALYRGGAVVPLGERIGAWPLGSLWS